MKRGESFFLIRVFGSLLIVPFASLVIFYSRKPLLYLFPSLFLLALSTLAAYELSSILKKIGYSISRPLSLGSLLIVQLLVMLFGLTSLWVGAAFLIPLVLAICFKLAASEKLDLSNIKEELAAHYFFLIYLAAPFWILQSFLLPPTFETTLSPRGLYTAFFDVDTRSALNWQIAFFLLTVKGSDVGAFLVGYYLGRRPLAPSISPAKTWEGVLGGLLFADILGLTFSWMAPEGTFTATQSTLSMMAISFGLMSQLGDLFESYLKRLAKVKDSGNIPRFGGALDMVDSLLFASFLFLFFLKMEWF